MLLVLIIVMTASLCIGLFLFKKIIKKIEKNHIYEAKEVKIIKFIYIMTIVLFVFLPFLFYVVNHV